MKNISVEFWNSRASRYDDECASVEVRERAISQLLNSLPTTVRSVVDLGAGTGKLSLELLDKFPDAHFFLVDASQKMLDEAKIKLAKASPRSVLKFIASTFEAGIALPDSSCDLIVSSFAIHHIPDHEKLTLATEMSRILKPSGKILVADEIVFDPSLLEDEDALFLQMAREFYPDHSVSLLRKQFENFKEYPTSASRMINIFKEAGFDVNLEKMSPLSGVLAATLANQ